MSILSQDAMVKALKMGYRLVDTAQAYENEARQKHRTQAVRL